MSKIRNFICDESGAAAAEYALILAIIATAIATGLIAMRAQIIAAITRATDALTAANAAA
jgi:pilus assembly protein Flp/PilA